MSTKRPTHEKETVVNKKQEKKIDKFFRTVLAEGASNKQAERFPKQVHSSIYIKENL